MLVKYRFATMYRFKSVFRRRQEATYK